MTSHRRGVVAVIIRQGRFLVIRRSEAVVAPRTYCFPGGGIEDGETQEVALVREIREELDAEIMPVRAVWHAVTPWGVTLDWWLAELAPASGLVANPAEVESIHWCTPGEMAALPALLESNRAFLAAWQRNEIELPPEFLNR
jgi:8-oxo-dGTP diphosphatase